MFLGALEVQEVKLLAFKIYLPISDFTSVCPSISAWVSSSSAPIPAVISQNGTNKSCFAWIKSQKHAFWVALTLQ